MMVLGPAGAAPWSPLAWGSTPPWADLAVASCHGGLHSPRCGYPVRGPPGLRSVGPGYPPCPVSYTHLRAHETSAHL
eukprot:2091488-Alexandrium_andersonii.AAC.1